jgi:xanthine dehydrogenase accessory factor
VADLAQAWAGAARDRFAAADPAALVTVMATEGSAPREAGVKMAVWGQGQAGTIGGGKLEFVAAQQARAMLSSSAGFAVQDYPLGPFLQQCCGGRVRLLIERIEDGAWLDQAASRLDAALAFELRTRFDDQGLIKSISGAHAPQRAAVELAGAAATARGARPAPGDLLVEHIRPVMADVILFGAGHVGAAIARALAPLAVRLHWYDSRPEAAALTGALLRSEVELAAVAAAPHPGSYLLIMTHDHGLDYALTRAALAGGGFEYLGLIGSLTKRARFVSRLRGDGLDDARLTCPIGVPQLRSKDPEVIAVSVAADLLMRLEGTGPAA